MRSFIFSMVQFYSEKMLFI